MTELGTRSYECAHCKATKSTNWVLVGGKWYCKLCDPKTVRQVVDVDHSSEALALHPDEIPEALLTDKSRFGAAAPDKYDPNGTPHWQGPVASVLKRKRKYMRSQGMVDANSFI